VGVIAEGGDFGDMYCIGRNVMESLLGVVVSSCTCSS
jgi:hypothetical protein